MKKKIIHLITDLETGGAQTMLYKLLKYTDKTKYHIEVLSMMDKGVIGKKIEALGITVHTLNITKSAPNPFMILKAIRICNNSHIMQTWMYHADLLGFIISLFTRPQKLLWGIRHSISDTDKKSTILVARINALLSKYVSYIISCSERAVTAHHQIGYEISRMIVIPNGFEIDKFYKKIDSKKILCNELALMEDTIIITRAARWHSMKDYENLFKAISILQNDSSNFILICCGDNINNENGELIELLHKYNISDKVILLNRRIDMDIIMSATDIFVSSSIWGEGFPNVLGEAMACETPCVTTDVGDSAYIVGSTGKVVEPGKYQDLAVAIKELVDMPECKRQELGIKARQRIIEEFEINKVCNKYEKMYN